MLIRPPRRELPAWKRLPVEGAREFLYTAVDRPRGTQVDCAELLGRAEVHIGKLLEVIDSEVAPW